MMLAHSGRGHAAYLSLGQSCPLLSATRRLARRMAVTSNIIAAEDEGD